MDWRIHHREVTASTNLDALGGRHGDVWTADFQTAGRGRLDHKWVSERGCNLMLSAVLDVSDVDAGEAATLPLAAGLAVAEAVDSILPSGAPRAQVKWPNDVWVDGRKIAGLLCQRADDCVIVGVGVNVNQREFPSELVGRAVSLCLARGSRELSVATVRDAVLAALARVYEDWRAGGFAAVRGALDRRDALKGREIAVFQTDGDAAPVRGICGGIASDGSLVVGDARVYAGEAHVASVGPSVRPAVARSLVIAAFLGLAVAAFGGNPPRSAAEWGDRYRETRSEADRLAWVSALDAEGHDFTSRPERKVDARGVYKFNRESRLASFVLSRELAERLGHDRLAFETEEGPVSLVWTNCAGRVDYEVSAPTNWDVFVSAWGNPGPRNPKAEANVSFVSYLPRRGRAVLAITHHREDWAAGPWASVAFPTNAIRAANHFAYGAREALLRLGFDRDDGSGEFVWMGTFDTNFPNGHGDYPPHFHVIPHCRDGRQVHHFWLDERGRITGDSLQEMGTVTDDWDRVYAFRPGEEIACYDGRGRVSFRMTILPDGSGLEFASPSRDVRYRVSSEEPAADVVLSRVEGTRVTPIGTYEVTDDPLKGRLVTPEGETAYDPEPGK